MELQSQPGAGEPNRRIRLVVLSAIVAAGLLLRAWPPDWSLPDFFEEAIPLRHAMLLWSGGPIDSRFFVYPALTTWLHLLVQSLHYLVGSIAGAYVSPESFGMAFTSNPTLFVVISRLLTALIDTGSIALLYIVGRDFGGFRVGAAASALLAFNPLAIREAHLINVDSPLTFFILLFVYFMTRVLRTGGRKWYLLAGLAAGAAASTKYNGAVLLLVFLAVVAFEQRSARKALEVLAAPHVLLAVGLAGFVFLLLNPLILFHLGDFLVKFQRLQATVGSTNLGMDPGISSARYYLLQSLPQTLGWMLFIAATLSLVTSIFRKNPGDRLLFLVALVYFIMIASWHGRADRYLLPLVPLLILSAIIGVRNCEALVASRAKLSLRVSRWIAPAFVALAIFPLAGRIVHDEVSFRIPDTRTLVAGWLASHYAKGTVVAAGPFGIDYSKIGFVWIAIPFNMFQSEMLSPFYDTRWYEDLDLVVAGDFDYERYRMEPGRFRKILAFYDSLDARWNRVGEITPQEGQQGGAWRFYSPPPTKVPRFEADLLAALGAVGNDPLVVAFMDRLSSALHGRGKLEKCVQLMSLSVKLDPRRPGAYLNLAMALGGLGRYDEAMREVRRCLALSPDNAEGTAIEGIIYLSLNNLEKATTDLTRALALDPSLFFAYDDLLSIYRRQNDRAKEIDLLRKYLGHLPSGSPKAGLLQERLKELGGK